MREREMKMNESRCYCGKYELDPDHSIALFNSNDEADERHAVGACQLRPDWKESNGSDEQV